MSFRRRSSWRAARSSAPACRSIPAICWCWVRSTASAVIGAPGCARSPKENGFDWVLDRLIAGLDVTASDIAGMGVGGLLMEIPTRPQPREPLPRSARPARGRHRASGRRPVQPHGRPEQADGAVRRQAAGAPHRRARARLEGRAARSSSPAISASVCAPRLPASTCAFADNPDFADGLSTSLKAGIADVCPTMRLAP